MRGMVTEPPDIDSRGQFFLELYVLWRSEQITLQRLKSAKRLSFLLSDEPDMGGYEP